MPKNPEAPITPITNQHKNGTRMKTLPRYSLMAIAIMTSCHAAYAAEKVAPAKEKTLDTVQVIGEREDYKAGPTSTANKTETPTLETAQSVQTITRAVLQDQNVSTLTEAVRNVAGTGSDFGFNGSALPLLILRGFPTVSMSARGPMGGSSSYFLDGSRVQGLPVNISNTESVEVVKGPASVLYGRAEPGGLVNVVSRKPTKDFGFSFEQTVGSYGLSNTALEVSGAINDSETVIGRAAASYSDSDSIRDFVTDRLASFSGNVTWAPSEKTKLSLTADYVDQNYRNDFGVPAIGNRPLDIPLENQFNEGGPLSSTKATAFKLDFSQQISDNWKLNLHAYSLNQDAPQFDVLPITFFTGQAGLIATGNIDRYYSYFPEASRDLFQGNIDFIGNFVSGNVEHTVLVGADSYSDKFDSLWTSYLPTTPINVYNPVYGTVPALDLSSVSLIPSESRSRWTGVYVQDQISFGNGWHLVAALRHESTAARYGEPTEQLNKASFLTPRLGAVWNFSDNQSVYAQYQDAVASNNGRAADGSELEAERARQFEIGHKFESGNGGLSSTVALYQLTKRNLANYVFSSTSPTGFDIITVGEARSRGLEWDLAGRINDKLSILASYAYTDADVTKDSFVQGARLPNVARHSGSTWLRYSLTDQWNLGGGVFFQGSREGDQANTFQLPGYARFDAMLGYRFDLGEQRASLQLNINNVFDKRYYTGSHQFVTDWIAPGDPRSVALTFRIER